MNFAQIIIEMNRMLTEVKNTCKFEKIITDLIEYCDVDDTNNCSPKQILMRVIAKFMNLSQILTTMINQTSKVGVRSPFQKDEYAQANFIGLQFGSLLKEILDF